MILAFVVRIRLRKWSLAEYYRRRHATSTVAASSTATSNSIGTITTTDPKTEERWRHNGHPAGQAISRAAYRSHQFKNVAT